MRDLFDLAVRAVSAEAILPHDLPVPVDDRLHIIAVGKAAADMMQVALTRVRHQSLGRLLVVTRYGHLPVGGIKRPDVDVIEAGHPYPDIASVQAADIAQKRFEKRFSANCYSRSSNLCSVGGGFDRCLPVVDCVV